MSVEGSQEYDDGKLFVGGLSWETTEESLAKYFSQFGEVVEATVKKDKVSNNPRGFGFVKFKDVSCIPCVLDKSRCHELDGKKIDPKLATAKGGKPERAKVFVGGIPPLEMGVTLKTITQELQTLMEQSSNNPYQPRQVTEVDVKTDKETGRHRGFAFVTFLKQEDADEVCKTKYFAFKGKNIEVKMADSKQFRQGSGGYSGGQQVYYDQSQHQHWDSGTTYPGSGPYGYGGNTYVPAYDQQYHHQHHHHQGGSTSGGQMPGYDNYGYSHGSTRGETGATGYGQSYQQYAAYSGHQGGSHTGYGTQHQQQQSGYYGHPTPQPHHN